MDKSHGGKREGAGRKSLEELYGERIVEMTVRLPESYYVHISQFNVSAAEYVRKLIASDLASDARHTPH